MILFDETENKYYELMAYLLRGGGGYSRGEAEELLKGRLSGEADFEVTDALFAAEEGEELVFRSEGGRLEPVLKQTFPIRNSAIESQAAGTLPSDPYIRHFLSEETVGKLRAAVSGVCGEWDPADISVKNLFARGASVSDRVFREDLATVIRAIRDRRAIRYDNIRPGRVEKRGAKAFPVRVEFSIVNDRFRISAYEPEERRFIKMNLDTMREIGLLEEAAGLDLEAEYQAFLKRGTGKILLEAEPIDHVIERCFRVFSYYDRKAQYDKAEGRYLLEISYRKADEREVVKNILSLGSYVVVLEPESLRREVRERILAAAGRYG